MADMADLHAAVAHVLKREMWVVKVAGLSDAEAAHLARAVVGVCLAEAQRAVEALRAEYAPECADETWSYYALPVLGEALAVLAALAEEQA